MKANNCSKFKYIITIIHMKDELMASLDVCSLSNIVLIGKALDNIL